MHSREGPRKGKVAEMESSRLGKRSDMRGTRVRTTRLWKETKGFQEVARSS